MINFMERSDLDFIRDTLVTALNEKRDGIIGDLFKLYEEVQNRPTIPSGNINITKDKVVVDGINYDQYNFNLTSEYVPAAGDFIVGGAGTDVISFGDYQSRED
jgi:hypothetical protein